MSINILRVLFAVLFYTASAGFLTAQSTLEPTKKDTLKIFDDDVIVNTYESTVGGGTSPITFVSLHHSEQVGLGLVKQAFQTRPGRLVELVSLKQVGERKVPERLVYFKLRNKQLCFDPNRIFSNDGVKKTLNGTCGVTFLTLKPPEQQDVVEKVIAFREQLLPKFLPPGGGVLVAVHNNTDEALSSMDFFEHGIMLDDVRNMKPKESARAIHGRLKALVQNSTLPATDLGTFLMKEGLEHKNIEAAYVVTSEDADDFIIVSTKVLFDRLFNRQLSMGLQKDVPDQSDGYLSTWCAVAQHKIDYVIIEAEHGKNRKPGVVDRGRNRQRQMIEWLYEKFPAQ